MTNEREWPLTEGECNALLFLAEKNPRKRAKKKVGEPREDVRIILNAVLPDSYIRPHKHENSHTPALVGLQGLFKVLIFDDEGVVIDTTLVSRGKTADIPANTWHSVVVLAPCAFLEAKSEFEKREIFAPWAPEEGTPEGGIYLEELRKVVDKKEAQG